MQHQGTLDARNTLGRDLRPIIGNASIERRFDREHAVHLPATPAKAHRADLAVDWE